MRIEIIDNLTALKAIEQKWTALLEQSPSDSLYLTFDWLLAWWEILGDHDGRKLHVVTLYEGDQLAAIVPFVIAKKTRSGFKRNVLEFLGTGEKEEDEVCSNYMGVISLSDPEKIWKHVWPHIAQGFKNKLWDEVSLRGMYAHEMKVDYAFENCHVSIEQTTPCAIINLPASWDEYMSSLSKKWRDQIKRGQKELASKGKVEYRNLVKLDELKEAFKEFIVLHQLKWKTAGHKGLFDSEKFNCFQHTILERFAPKGYISIDRLTCDGRLVASSVKLTFKNTVYFYLPAYDPNFEMKIGLGLLERSYDLAHEISQGAKVYDFYRAAPGSYKWHMAKDKRDVGKIEIQQKTPTFYFLSILTNVKSVVRKLISLCRGKQK